MRLLPVGFAVLFAVAHTQSPLYYSNQNQYFLHGAALAGVGDLRSDWLANTADPTPVFSAFVAFGFRYLGEWSFQAVYFLALMAYFLSAWWLVKPGPRTGPVFAALFTLLHAGIVRWASDRLLGADYPWFFHCGLASQYILGAGLQPSVIGVALFASVAAYRDDRSLLAVGLAAGANLLHSTYLLPAAMLIAGYLTGEAARGRWKTVGLGALFGIAIVAPVVVHILTVFAPDPTCFDEAQRIIAFDRIPHHTRPARWFDWVAGLQVLWMLAGLQALRGTRLFLPLCVTMALAVLGTVAVIITENPTLSLMFPWRITAVLVPVATAVLPSWFLEWGERENGRLVLLREPEELEVEQRTGLRRCLKESGFFALSGVAILLFQLGYREPEAEDAALQYVAEHHKPGEVYLVPARFAKPTTARGVYSNTFTKAPDPSAVVYFEMARFRLATGAALYVDFKAIPYKDTEVMEWHRRVSRCVEWFKDADWDGQGVVEEISREGITHVIAPTALGLRSTRLEAIPLDRGAYTVYRLR